MSDGKTLFAYVMFGFALGYVFCGIVEAVTR